MHMYCTVNEVPIPALRLTPGLLTAMHTKDEAVCIALLSALR
jgi:hypothetical protein